MTEIQKRHCWEFLQRRLVCDSVRPACKRCGAAGILCPGYNDAKPRRLRWLPTGRVLSRTRRKKQEISRKTEDSSIKTTVQPKSLDNKFPVAPDLVIPRVRLMTEQCAIIQAVEYCKYILKRRDCATCIETLTSLVNTYIYKDLEHVNELGPNPHIYRITPSHVQRALIVPGYLRVSIVCVALSHRMNRLGEDWEDLQFNVLRERYYLYRGIIIQSLNGDIGVTEKQLSDILIAGVITLFLTDVSCSTGKTCPSRMLTYVWAPQILQDASPNWRYHLEGAQKLITLRGGFRTLAKSRNLVQVLFEFFQHVIDTPCPAHSTNSCS